MPKEIVKFFILNNNSMNKTLLGEMLGGNKDENKILIQAYG